MLTNLVRDLQTREVQAGRVLRYEPMAGNVPGWPAIWLVACSKSNRREF